jgi:maltose alpha-D-glucosyltransferase/alpha-amylase
LFRQETRRDQFGRRTGNSYFDKTGKGNIHEFLSVFSPEQDAVRGKGYVSIPTGNHDITRLSMDRSEEEIRVAFAFVMTTSGVPFIYYGDELGMKYVEGLPSKEGAYGRTGSRTPMQWSRSVNSGFSVASEDSLYLPVSDPEGVLNVEAQYNDESSMLNFVKELVSLRKFSPALQADGDFIPLYAEADSYPFVYKRQKDGEEFVVVINPADREETATCDLDLSSYSLIQGVFPQAEQGGIKAAPVSFSILKKS